MLTTCLLPAKSEAETPRKGPHAIRKPSSRISRDLPPLSEGHSNSALEAQILRPSISLAREGRHRGGLPLSSQDVPGFQGLEKVLLAQSRPGVFKRFLAHQLNTSRHCQHRFCSGSGLCTGVTVGQIRSVWHLAC